MIHYRNQRENVIGSFRPQNRANNVNDIVQTFQLFFNKELLQKIVEETNHYID